MLDEVLRQRVDQFGVARRVGDAHVVHRLNEATAHKMGPDAIADGPGEEGVVRCDAIQSTSFWRGSSSSLIFNGGAVEAARLHQLAGRRIVHIAVGPHEDGRLLRNLAASCGPSAPKNACN